MKDEMMMEEYTSGEMLAANLSIFGGLTTTAILCWTTYINNTGASTYAAVADSVKSALGPDLYRWSQYISGFGFGSIFSIMALMQLIASFGVATDVNQMLFEIVLGMVFPALFVIYGLMGVVEYSMLTSKYVDDANLPIRLQIMNYDGEALLASLALLATTFWSNKDVWAASMWVEPAEEMEGDAAMEEGSEAAAEDMDM